MEKYSVYLPIDRLIAIQQGATLPDHASGTALFADISGFTPLTEALVREFGSQRGAEELTRYINQVYDELISCLHHFGGTVISFAGDAITCWFDQDDGLQAASCALCMQDSMKQFANIGVSSSRAGAPGLTVTLAVKIALATGPARRFVVGNPDIQLIDVLGGSTLYDLAQAEHQAEKGEIILAPSVVTSLGNRVEYSDWRTDHDSGVQFGVLKQLLASVAPKPFKILSDTLFKEEDLRPWLLPPVYQRLQQGQGEFLAELRPALALFLNFVGIDFDHDEAAGEKLNAYMLWAQKILARYDAYVFQLIVGDKGNYLYAAFGAPVAHEDDSVRAVSAALDLLTPPAELDYIKELKIGISRGRLHTGAYGSTQRRTYGMLGDDVNLAARLMQAAAPGQILTNLTVKQSTGNFFRWETLPEIRVKGKAEPVAVFSPLGMQPRQAMRLHTLNYTLPMVGREIELALVDEKIKLARQSQGQVVGIIGEAGIGKSRLVHELVLRADDAGFFYFDGECQSIAIDASYWVWQPVWRSIFKLDPAQSTAEQIAKIDEHLNAIDPALVARLPLLEAVMNLSIPDNDLTATLDAKLRKSSLEALLVDCLRAAAQEHPMVIVLENCQWMDALSHELTEILGRTARELPVLIVLAYRPLEIERLRQARISRLPNFTEIALSEFTPEQAYHLIFWKLEQLDIRQADIPAELVNRIIAQSQGNPFYIEELLNYIHDQNLHLTDPNALLALELPTSLHSLILSRLDQLPDKQKTTLKVASIVGRIFRAALLWGMYPELGRPEQVQNDLELISTMQLTTQDLAEQDLTYFFKQIVTQQVAYENLPYATRAMLHNHLAKFIELNSTESMAQNADLLAFHYLRGENWPKALEYNLLAAQRNQYEYANEAAVAACKNALEAANNIRGKDISAEKLTAYEILGDVLTLLGRYEEALQNLIKAKELVESWLESMERNRHLVQLHIKISMVHERRSEFDSAFSSLQTGLSSIGDTLTIEAANVYLMGTGIYRRQGRNDEAIEWCEKGLQIARQIQGLNAQQVVAQSYYNLGGIYTNRGDLQKAIQYCSESVKIYDDIQDAVGLAKAYNNLGIAFTEAGDYDEAQAAFNKSLDLARKIGDAQQAGIIANGLADIHQYQGEWTRALTLYKQSNAVWKQLGTALFDAVTLSNLAQMYIYQNELDLGEEALRQSELLFTSLGTEGFLSELYRRWSELHLRRQAMIDARAFIQRSIELAIAQQDRIEEAKSLRVLGEIHLANEDTISAFESLTKSLEIATESNSKYEAARTSLTLAKAENLLGKTDFARTHLVQALEVFKNLGAQYYVDEVLNLTRTL